jgi:acetylornithine deacetylase/succinyl-diaminopimelate desuccinylase-like protein
LTGVSHAAKGKSVIGPFPEAEFLELHRRLVCTLAPPNHEEPRHRLLASLLDERGIAHRSDNAGNLIASLGSGPWSEAVVLDAHLDVVERGGSDEVRSDGPNLVGLGVGDDLAAVTMLALALIRLHGRSAKLSRQLVFLFSTGEEGLGNLRGIRQFVADRRDPPYAYLAFDGSQESYSLTGLGSLRYKLLVETPGGHSWGDFGVPNAIEVMVDCLADARRAWAETVQNAAYGNSYNFGTIEGGQGINSIARHAQATFEYRSVSPSVLDQLAASVQQLQERLRSRYPQANVVIQLLGQRPAGTAPHQERLRPLVEAVLDPTLRASEVPMSTNINVPIAHGWPAVCLGLCQCGNAHREDEYLRLDSLPIGWQGLDALFRLLQANPPSDEPRCPHD